MATAFDQMLKEREKFLRRLRDESRRVAGESEKAANRRPEDLLARYAAKVEAAKRAKDEAIQLHDEEIAHYSVLIEELQRTIEATDVPDERPTVSDERDADASSSRGRKATAPRKKRREG